jgi:hypothetical protein
MANQKKPATPSKPADPAKEPKAPKAPEAKATKPSGKAAEESKAPAKAEEPKETSQLALPAEPEPAKPAAKAAPAKAAEAPAKAAEAPAKAAEAPKAEAPAKAAEAPRAEAPVKAEAAKAAEAPGKAGKKEAEKGKAPFVAVDSAAALEHFRAEAGALPGEPEPCTADIDLVRANVADALAALEPHLDAVSGALPRIAPATLRELPALVQALDFAMVQASPPEASKGEIEARLKKVRPARALALRQLEILSDEQVGLIPPAKVQKIRQGTGQIDTARDAVAIRALFLEYYLAVSGKHPLTQTFLDELAQDGEWLLARLRPKNAPAPREDGEADPMVRLRDQLWTLLQKRYDDAYQVAVEVWGRRAAETHVPPLQSRRAAAKAPAPPA